MKDLPVALKPTDSMIAKYQRMKIPKEGKGIEAVMDLLHTEVLNYNYRSNHPRTFSFVPGPASQLSWLTDFFYECAQHSRFKFCECTTSYCN